MHRLRGYLLAIEVVIKHETGCESVDKEAICGNEGSANDVKKVERRLKFWSRKPDHVHAKILSCFLNIRHLEGASPVPVGVLKQRYVAETCTWENIDPSEAEREFGTSFGVMSTLSANHCKVFDLANGHVTIWPKASTAVEAFRKQRRIAL